MALQEKQIQLGNVGFVQQKLRTFYGPYLDGIPGEGWEDENGRLARFAGVAIVAIDPGETTGLCGVFLRKKEVDAGPVEGLKTAFKKGRVKFAQVKAKNENESALFCRQFFDEFCEFVDSKRKIVAGSFVGEVLTLCVIEDFILREHTQGRNLLAPVRLTAKIDMLLYLADQSDSVCVQDVSSAKGIISDERLKQWGFKFSHDDRHSKDALRHAALLLRKVYNEHDLAVRRIEKRKAKK